VRTFFGELAQMHVEWPLFVFLPPLSPPCFFWRLKETFRDFFNHVFELTLL
jgi:hypothetical protein